jgi:hypothetical protein
MIKNLKKIYDCYPIIFLCITIIVGTFPDLDFYYSPGIDSSLSWLFNFIFENNLKMGQHIIFPHGPLAFVIYPLYNNVVLSILIISTLKVLLFLNIYKLLYNNPLNLIIAFVLTYLISLFSNVYDLIRINIIAYYCLYYLNPNQIYKYLGFFLTSYALYVKANVGIVSLIITCSFLIYECLNKGDYKLLFKDTVLLISLIILFWLFIYQSFTGILNYFIGFIHLVEDNSSAVSLYPYNNWLVLTIFIFTSILVPILNFKDKKSNYFTFITSLSIFSIWKYGMARQDNDHSYSLLYYILLVFILYTIFVRPKGFISYGLMILSCFLYTINLKNTINYSPYRYDFIKVNNFLQFILEYDKLKEDCLRKSREEISVLELPKEIKELMINKYVDVYPWEYTIVPANELKLCIRPVVQSYAAYTSWLDKQNANFYKKPKAEFLILHFVKDIIIGGDFNSIDGRYLFNDEPNTIIEIIKNYEYFWSDNRFLVLKKRNKPITCQKIIFQKCESNWNKWINVPHTDTSLLRVKLHFERSMLQKLKSFFYKDEQFWIYLKLQNDEILKYRIIPKNAEDGIWINPFILKLNDNHCQVKEIMFLSSNNFILKPKIQVLFEEIKFSNNTLSNLFQIKQTYSQTVYSSINDFEQKELKQWFLHTPSFSQKYTYRGKNSLFVAPKSFSSTFFMSMDSLPSGNYRIHTNCWAYLPKYFYKHDILLVIETEKANGQKTWKGVPVDEQTIDTGQWINISAFENFNYDSTTTQIKVYLWNNSENEIYLDDFHVSLIKVP